MIVKDEEKQNHVSLCDYLHTMNKSIHQECVLGECLM